MKKVISASTSSFFIRLMIVYTIVFSMYVLPSIPGPEESFAAFVVVTLIGVLVLLGARYIGKLNEHYSVVDNK